MVVVDVETNQTVTMGYCLISSNKWLLKVRIVQHVCTMSASYHGARHDSNKLYNRPLIKPIVQCLHVRVCVCVKIVDS